MHLYSGSNYLKRIQVYFHDFDIRRLGGQRLEGDEQDELGAAAVAANGYNGSQVGAGGELWRKGLHFVILLHYFTVR